MKLFNRNKKPKDDRVKTFLEKIDDLKAKTDYKKPPLIQYYPQYKAAMLFFVLSVGAIIGSYFFIMDNKAYATLLLIYGMACFMPLGLIIGFILFNPIVRIKAMRQMGKKNYGLVNLVGKGGHIIQKTVDFDGGLLWIKNAVWYLEQNRVANIDAPSEDFYNISSDNVRFVSGIPIIYLNMDTMRPLTFFKDDTPIKPAYLGANLKGWTSNQIAKWSNLVRTYYIVIAILLLCIGIAYGVYTILQDVETLKNASASQTTRLNEIWERMPKLPATAGNYTTGGEVRQPTGGIK